MKARSPAQQAYYQARQGTDAQILVWISAKDRASGTPMPMGFWTGDDHETITVAGQPRTYYGAGDVIDPGTFTFRTGMTVQMQRLSLTPLSPEVEQMIRGYDARLAPIEIHRATYDLFTGALIDIEELFAGTIDEAPLTIPALNGTAGLELSIAGAERSQTRTLTDKFSDASQQAISAGDIFYRYVDVSAADNSTWGGGPQRIAPPAPARTHNANGRPDGWMR